MTVHVEEIYECPTFRVHTHASVSPLFLAPIPSRPLADTVDLIGLTAVVDVGVFQILSRLCTTLTRRLVDKTTQNLRSPSAVLIDQRRSTPNIPLAGDHRKIQPISLGSFFSTGARHSKLRGVRIYKILRRDSRVPPVAVSMVASNHADCQTAG